MINKNKLLKLIEKYSDEHHIYDYKDIFSVGICYAVIGSLIIHEKYFLGNYINKKIVLESVNAVENYLDNIDYKTESVKSIKDLIEVSHILLSYYVSANPRFWNDSHRPVKLCLETIDKWNKLSRKYL